MGKSALRLDTRRALKDGSYPVQVKVGYGTNLYLSTGLYLAPSDWNANLQVCVGPGSRKINNILGMLLLKINNRIVELSAINQQTLYSYSTVAGGLGV